jgi:predicted PurR-regulated permease PerM
MVAVPRISNEFGKLAREGEKLLLSLTPDKIEEYTYRVRDWFEESGLPVRIVTPQMVDSEGAQQAGFVIHIDEVIRDSVAELTESLRRNFFAFLKVGPRFAVRVFRNILMTFLILMVAGFLLVNPERLLDYFRSLFPNRFHEGYQEVCQEIDAGLSGVVRGQVLICLVNGVLTFIGLLILGVKFPVMLSTLAAVMSLIPIFGSILSSIPIVAVALTSSFMTGVGTLAWIVGIHLLEANLLNPKIMGESARIHPALVIFALVVGEHFYGLVGALFAVPIASVFLAFFRVLHRRAIKWNQEAQAGEPPESSQSDNHEQPGGAQA